MRFQRSSTAMLGIALLAGAASAAADEQKATPTPTPPANAQSGVKAYVDPETGALRNSPANPADSRALDQAFIPDNSKVQEIRKADGSVEWILNGQADSTLIATRGSDGKLRVTCAEHGTVHDHAPIQNAGGRDEQ